MKARVSSSNYQKRSRKSSRTTATGCTWAMVSKRVERSALRKICRQEKFANNHGFDIIQMLCGARSRDEEVAAGKTKDFEHAIPSNSEACVCGRTLPTSSLATESGKTAANTKRSAAEMSPADTTKSEHIPYKYHRVNALPGSASSAANPSPFGTPMVGRLFGRKP
jgi:hypothetical protein